MYKYFMLALTAAALTAQATPIFNIFELGIQLGQTTAYDEVGKHNITTSITSEKGTLAMYSAKRTDQPLIAYMLEIYADETAYQAHIQSPQYREFLRRSPEILTEHKHRIEAVPQFLGDKKVHQTTATINKLVVVDIKPEYSHAFRSAVISQMAQSLQAEKGALAMYAATAKTNPNRWYFYEIYTDKIAYQQHRQSPHFQAYLKHTAQMLHHKKTIQITPALLANKGGLQFIAP